jgi:hypothetical protein
MAEFAVHTVALLVYPGALLVLGPGLAGELAVTRVAPREAVRTLLGSIASPLGIPSALLAVLAAVQLAIPFNPVHPVERNLLVAAVSLAGVSWLGRARAWSGPAEGARLLLVAQACWLVALLAPALISESLRPQVLGAIAVPAAIPVKIGSAALYLLCLPMLLGLVPEGERQGAVSLTRTLLWLPLCGLFAALFFPPAPDSALGLLRFAGLTVAAAGAAVLIAALARRRQPFPAALLYLRVAPALAALVLLVAAATAGLT